MGWGLGVGEAKPGTEPISTGREPEPGHCTVKQGNAPSLLSASRVLVPSDLELTTCLSPAVLPSSLLTSPQTACDGRVLWVSTPLSVDCVESDGKSKTSLTAPPILGQQAWRMLGHVGLRSGTGCELGGCCVRLLTFVVLCIHRHMRPWEPREVKFSCLSF